MFGQLARNRAVQVSAAFLLLTLIAAAVIVPGHRGLAERSGLQGRYRAADSTTAPFEAIDRTLTEASIRTNARQLPTTALSIVWTGYVIAPQRGTYRFWVPPCVQQLTIDRRVAGSEAMPSGGPEVELSRGMHAIEVQLACADVPPEFHIEWARGAAAFRTIPPLLFVPALRDRGEVRTREWLTIAGESVPVAWLCGLVLLVAAVAWFAIQWHARKREPQQRAALATLTAGAAALFIAGIWWGIPNIDSWAADEVVPSDVGYIVAARFAHGRATIYPPLHYAVLALAFTPFRVANSLGLTNLEDAVALNGLLIVGRLVSVAMGLGIVISVYHIAADLFGHRAGLFAGAVIAFSLPMAYYSKTANLDVPYVFWLIVGLYFYLRAASSRRAADYYWFAFAAAAAVCTKDQAYGFYVAPAAYIAIGSVLPEPRRKTMAGIPPPAVLVRMIAIAAVAFAVFHNLPFNFGGFREHLRLMTELEGFRMVPRTLAGLVTLSGTGIVQIANAMTWPLLVAAACGIVLGVRSRAHLSALLVMPAVSYHLFFVCVVLYHYDRFFLGVIGIFAVFAGACLDRLTQPGARYRAVGAAMTAAMLLFALSRAVALDLSMVRDSRYDAERWLRTHVQPEQRVVAVGFSSYQPRMTVVPWTFQVPAVDRLLADRPDVVIVNRDFARRSPPSSEDGKFYAALADGSAGYETRAEFRTTLPWPFDLDLTFGEDPNKGLSNLTKINPPIVIYMRQR